MSKIDWTAMVAVIVVGAAFLGIVHIFAPGKPYFVGFVLGWTSAMIGQVISGSTR